MPNARWLRRRLFELRIRVGAGIRPLAQPRHPGLVVSVTTYPARLDTFRLPLLSLLNQSLRAERLVVTLAEPEFPGRRLPAWLTRLARRGLVEIMWTDDNLRSYKKLIPVLRAHPDCVIVTADDDVLYPPGWLEGLVQTADRLPGTIVGYRARPVCTRPDGTLRPYIEWTPDKLEGLDLTLTSASEVMLTGSGGVLYPPGALPGEVMDVSSALSLCPTADDVWFWAMELRTGARLAVIPPGYLDFAAPLGSQARGTLMAVNVEGGANDRQIRSVLDRFGLWPALTGKPQE